MMKFRVFIITIILALSVTQCRKAYSPTGEDYSEYGWDFYDNGDYSDAHRWFFESVTNDTAYIDGYNGMGWTLGKMDSMAVSVSYFSMGIAYGDTTDYFEELLAGRMFANHTLKNYSSAISDGLVIIENDSLWTFSHNSNLNYNDIYIVLAASYFASADFENSLKIVQKLDNTFYTNVLTQAGISKLSNKIEALSLLYL